MAASGSANFVVTLEETALTYTGATTAQNGQPRHPLGRAHDRRPGAGLRASAAGRCPSPSGSGSAAQTCSGTTNASGAAACTIAVTGQPPGPIPVDGHLRR